MARLPKHENRCTYIEQSGARCPRVRADDLPVCQEHFDSTLDASANGSPITGRRMRVMGRLRQDYATALKDPTILRLEPVIALHDVRLTELIARIGGDDNEGGDTPEWRVRMRDLFKRYEAALAEADDKEASKCFEDLGKTLEDGVNRDKAWEQTLALGARRNALASEATELMLKSEQVVQVRDLVKILKNIALIVMEAAPRDVAFTIVNRVDSEVMGRLGSSPEGKTDSALGNAVRQLPGASDSVLSGSLGGGPLVDAGNDS